MCQRCLHGASLAYFSYFTSNPPQHNISQVQEEYLMCGACIIDLLPVEIKAIKAALPLQRQVITVPPGPAEPPLAPDIPHVHSSCVKAAWSAVKEKPNFPQKVQTFKIARCRLTAPHTRVKQTLTPLKCTKRSRRRPYFGELVFIRSVIVITPDLTAVFLSSLSATSRVALAASAHYV